MNSKILEAARRLGRARNLVVLTGAGISKESGIPTFREAQEGLWAQYDPMEMASRTGFLANPRRVWEWYTYRFGMVEAARPNPGHYAIAELETLIPSVAVITQNIDELHQAAGSTRVYELHGSIRRYKCLSERHTGFTLADFAGQTELPPRCPHCGDLIRPDIVWFGEYLPQAVLATAYSLSNSCDVMLVAGTSGVVQPAASLPYMAAESGAFVIDVNPEPDEISRIAALYLRGKGGEMLPQLVAALRDHRGKG